MTDQRDKTSNGTQNPIPRTATAGELLAVKKHHTVIGNNTILVCYEWQQIRFLCHVKVEKICLKY